VGNTRLVDKDGVINPDGFYNYLTAWFNQDPMTYYVSQGNLHPQPPDWQFDERLETSKIKSDADLSIFQIQASYYWFNIPVPPAPVPVFSQIPFFVNDLTDTPTIIDMITVYIIKMKHINLHLSICSKSGPFATSMRNLGWKPFLKESHLPFGNNT